MPLTGDGLKTLRTRLRLLFRLARFTGVYAGCKLLSGIEAEKCGDSVHRVAEPQAAYATRKSQGTLFD